MVFVQRLLVLCGAAWALAACATLPPAEPPLSPEQLANAEYRSELLAGETVRLANGRYRQGPGGDASPVPELRLGAATATGDLNGDGVPDAAVILIADRGDGDFRCELAAVVNEGGKPRHGASVSLGERVTVLSLAIRSGVISVDYLCPGPGDPAFCVRERQTEAYRLEGNRLGRVWGPVP